MANASRAAIVAFLIVAGCNDNQSSNPTAPNVPVAPSPPPKPIIPPAPPHNYSLKEGSTYSYISAVSEEDEKKGKATGEVAMYRYLGLNDGTYKLVSVDGYGNSLQTYSCAEQCIIIKAGPRRIAYSPGSMIGAVFQDAINGQLTPYHNPYPLRVATLPKAFQGEWNDDLSSCGTGLSDSRLRISSKQLAFYESEGPITAVEMLREDKAKVDVSLSGEGEEWKETIVFTLSEDGRRLSTAIGNGSFDRKRCG